ncbi:hypothetical protein HN011_004609 [Eciton burchellii]|nr:hypothetical protein HN011_004609 [Eciton burchellii]
MGEETPSRARTASKKTFAQPRNERKGGILSDPLTKGNSQDGILLGHMDSPSSRPIYQVRSPWRSLRRLVSADNPLAAAPRMSTTLEADTRELPMNEDLHFRLIRIEGLRLEDSHLARQNSCWRRMIENASSFHIEPTMQITPNRQSGFGGPLTSNRTCQSSGQKKKENSYRREKRVGRALRWLPDRKLLASAKNVRSEQEASGDFGGRVEATERSGVVENDEDDDDHNGDENNVEDGIESR